MSLAKLGVFLLVVVNITACTSIVSEEAKQQSRPDYYQQEMMKYHLPPCGHNPPNLESYGPNRNFNCR